MKTKLLFLFCFLGLFLATQVRSETATSTLTVQIGWDRKSGETTPITNKEVHLLKNEVRFGKYVPNSDINKIMANFDKNVIDNTVFTSVTDFFGKAIFENIPDGTYYVFCEAHLGRGMNQHLLTYEKMVIVKGKTFVSLNNDDFLD